MTDNTEPAQGTESKLSKDLVALAIARVELEGATFQQVAAEFGVHPKTVWNRLSSESMGVGWSSPGVDGVPASPRRTALEKIRDGASLEEAVSAINGVTADDVLGSAWDQSIKPGPDKDPEVSRAADRALSENLDVDRLELPAGVSARAVRRAIADRKSDGGVRLLERVRQRHGYDVDELARAIDLPVGAVRHASSGKTPVTGKLRDRLEALDRLQAGVAPEKAAKKIAPASDLFDRMAMLSHLDMARFVGGHPSRLSDQSKRGHVIAVHRGNRAYYPERQVDTEGRMLPGVAKVLAEAGGDPEEACRMMWDGEAWLPPREGHGLVSREEMMSLMGVDRARLVSLRDQGIVIGLQVSGRVHRYPVWQLDAKGRPLPGVKAAIEEADGDHMLAYRRIFEGRSWIPDAETPFLDQDEMAARLGVSADKVMALRRVDGEFVGVRVQHHFILFPEAQLAHPEIAKDCVAEAGGDDLEACKLFLERVGA
ncbi:hypothetical protein CKO28_17450 [Rhodovibrio sodomensis]|uniref:HTH cro/C1-type domain-containing protein n=1 Tax=Rhodovibrio sodomensis TaxID=1088 RepID=A0ABS1DHY3_9PROT|nr:hypothetical protein [Rhodovibrio sodomensis]MBK1669824.1 hypothetical protein [Rhodovibrio sodomensis]